MRPNKTINLMKLGFAPGRVFYSVVSFDVSLQLRQLIIVISKQTEKIAELIYRLHFFLFLINNKLFVVAAVCFE